MLFIKRHWKLALAFGLYTNFYLTAELLFTDCAGTAFGEQAATVFYGAYCLTAAAGYYMFSLTRRVASTSGARRRLLFALGCAGAVSTLFAPHVNPKFMVALQIIAVLTAGYAGAAILRAISEAACAPVGASGNAITGAGVDARSASPGAGVDARSAGGEREIQNGQDENRFGLIVAIPYSGAFLLQYLYGFILPNASGAQPYIIHAVIAAAYASAVALLLTNTDPVYGYARRRPNNGSPELTQAAKPHEYGTPAMPAAAGDAKQQATVKYMRWALVSCLIISCLYGLIDGIIMSLHVGRQIDTYGWLRLICIPGLIVAGSLADYRGGRYFSFSVLMSMLAAITAVFLFNTESTYNAALGSCYFFFSFMTAYSLAVFVRSAGDTSRPDFWASAGRGLKYAAGGAFALTGSFVFTKLNYIVIALIYTALLVLLACIFYFWGRLSIAPEPPHAAPPRSEAMTFDEMTEFFGLTEREAEVLRLLVADKRTSEIASEMFITEGTVYKYISSMITKTETNNRFELVAICSKKQM